MHPARHKTFPDQLVEPELVPAQGIFDLCRRQFGICGTDRLMGILDLLFVFRRICSFDHILRTIVICDKSLTCLIRFLGNTGGIRSQISDQTDRPVSLYLDPLIQLLGDLHRLPRRKI